jgi:hypothetical protein
LFFTNEWTLHLHLDQVQKNKKKFSDKCLQLHADIWLMVKFLEQLPIPTVHLDALQARMHNQVTTQQQHP